MSSITTASAGSILRAGVSTRDAFASEGMTLRVNALSWAIGTDVEAVIAGTVAPESATLTADGRHYNSEGWHTGPESEWVRVERYTADGRVFHGWVDSVSRKLLQAG